MKLKIVLIFISYIFSNFSYGQFKSPEIKIIEPEIKLPENQLNYIKMFNKKLKKTIIDKKTTEYDESGTINKEIINDNPYKKTITYSYKNNIVIKKNIISEANSDEIKKSNFRTLREKANESEVAIYDDRNDTESYHAILDKKNRIISYTIEKSNKDNNSNKTSNYSYQTNILYDKNKIIEINRNNYKENYFYDKNVILKKEITQTQGETKNIETEEYLYDINKNLITIKLNKKTIFKEKTTYENNFTKDSASYDSKNRILRKGDKRNYTTYKYDSNNTLIERFQYQFGKEYSKEEFNYENNQMVNVTRTIFIKKNKDDQEQNSTITTYQYKGDQLVSYEISDSKKSFEKQISYDYDNENKLIKITTNTTFYYPKTNYLPRTEKLETRFNYTSNSLQITEPYGNVKNYEFY